MEIKFELPTHFGEQFDWKWTGRIQICNGKNEWLPVR